MPNMIKKSFKTKLPQKNFFCQNHHFKAPLRFKMDKKSLKKLMTWKLIYLARIAIFERLYVSKCLKMSLTWKWSKIKIVIKMDENIFKIKTNYIEKNIQNENGISGQKRHLKAHQFRFFTLWIFSNMLKVI